MEPVGPARFASPRNASLVSSPHSRTLNFPANSNNVPLSQRMGLLKGQAAEAAGGLISDSTSMSLDEMLAQQKRLIEQIASSDITAEKKAQLKKDFKALNEKSKELMQKQQQLAESAGSAEPQQPHRGAMGAQASGRMFDKRPKILLVEDVHEDLRFAGLIQCHFASFGKVLQVEPLSDDPSKWYVTSIFSYCVRLLAGGAGVLCVCVCVCVVCVYVCVCVCVCIFNHVIQSKELSDVT
jgi:hypothetical protein